jgi:hypothetical protein
MPVGNLKDGIYSIDIAIIDPLTGQPGLKFANENTRQDLIQYVGSFEEKDYLIQITTNKIFCSGTKLGIPNKRHLQHLIFPV